LNKEKKSINHLKKEIQKHKKHDPWIVLVLTSFALMLMTSMNGAHSPILPIIKKALYLTYTESGMLTTAFFLGYTLGQIPWGHIADRIGGKKVLIASISGISISIFFFGGSRNSLDALIWRFFAGLLGAGVFVPGVRLVSTWFPSQKRGIAIGLFGIGGNLGAIFMSIAAPQLASLYGWRQSIRFFSLIGFLSIPLLWVKLKASKERILEVNKKQLSLRSLLSQKSFWMLGYDQFMRLGSFNTMQAWLPIYLYEVYKLDLFIASSFLIPFNLIAIVSKPAGGLLSDRIGEKKVIIGTFAILGPSFIIFALMRNIILAFLLVGIFGFFINFLQGPIFSILPKIYGIESSGKISGYQNTFAAAGSFALPFILGYLKDYTASFVAGWISLGILCLIGFGQTILLRVIDIES
jgi:nitrate/nitrite transporter NarK